TAGVEDIEGGISETLGPGMDGLLGGSFLNEFVYQIDGSGGRLTLTPNREGKELYDGRDRAWWEMKYGHYVQAIRHYRALKGKMERGVSPAADNDLRATVGMTPADMGKIVAYYEDLLTWLERRAALAGTPKGWRKYP
ncbi:MAG: hypothetical protein HQK87_08585, partial [Nitrospinae bacterium]|nr:hypothetical protein [Nitrospinota bacterium]